MTDHSATSNLPYKSTTCAFCESDLSNNTSFSFLDNFAIRIERVMIIADESIPMGDEVIICQNCWRRRVNKEERVRG
jgi:hypothetical protein